MNVSAAWSPPIYLYVDSGAGDGLWLGEERGRNSAKHPESDWNVDSPLS